MLDSLTKDPMKEDFSIAMTDFTNFINSCSLIDPPLEGCRFMWSGHWEVPVISRIDRFLFSGDWEDHFQGLHRVILPKVTSDHFPILLRVGEIHSGKRLLNSKMCGSKWMDF